MKKLYGFHSLKKLKKTCWEHHVKVVWSYPLAKGIYDLLIEKLPKESISRKEIYSALHFHTNSPEYLKNLKQGNFRLSIDGKKTTKVTKEEFASAQIKLNKVTSYKRKGNIQNRINAL